MIREIIVFKIFKKLIKIIIMHKTCNFTESNVTFPDTFLTVTCIALIYFKIVIEKYSKKYLLAMANFGGDKTTNTKLDKLHNKYLLFNNFLNIFNRANFLFAS